MRSDRAVWEVQRGERSTRLAVPADLAGPEMPQQYQTSALRPPILLKINYLA